MAHVFAPDVIRFYTTKDEHGYMSNFARYKVTCFGREWMTSEHCYQAQKFSGMNQEDYDAVHVAPRPMDAATLGRDPNRPVRADWMQVRDDVMRFVVLNKFSQNWIIHNKLLETGDRPIYEQDLKRGDQYWAIDAQGVGKNMLGRIIMEVREVLREQKQFQDERALEISNCSGCIDRHNGIYCKEHNFLPSSPMTLYSLSLRLERHI